MPERVAQRMSEVAREMHEKGQRPEAIMERMREMAPDLADYQLRRFARTEASKAATALVQARAEQMGLQWYVWRTARDERVRSAHAMMDGVYCRWSDPPNPEALFPGHGAHNSGGSYPPGGIYNCRCIALPVVDDNDLVFPARVHIHGEIVTVGNIVAFGKLTGRAA